MSWSNVGPKGERRIVYPNIVDDTKQKILMQSVSLSWAILKGHKSGNLEDAAKFLGSLSPQEEKARNRSEGRVRARIRRKTLTPMGGRPRKRWAV
jgi:hypothetical protein